MCEGVERIEEELGCLGLLSAVESDRVATLLSGARSLEISLSEELGAAVLLRDRLEAIRRGLARTRRDQQRATSILDQCEASVNLGQEAVQQALSNCNVRYFNLCELSLIIMQTVYIIFAFMNKKRKRRKNKFICFFRVSMKH